MRSSVPSRVSSGSPAIRRSLAESSDLALVLRSLGLRAVDVLDGVLAGQALERHQRVAIAEHVGALRIAARPILGQRAGLALDVVGTRAVARARQPWTTHQVAHDTARHQQRDERAVQPRLYVLLPCLPAPPANLVAPSTASMSAFEPSSSSFCSAWSSDRSCCRYALIRSARIAVCGSSASSAARRSAACRASPFGTMRLTRPI